MSFKKKKNGAGADADYYDTRSKNEEMNPPMFIMMNEADTDGDGNIDPEELRTAQKMNDEYESVQRFQHYDLNHDGTITKDEIQMAQDVDEAQAKYRKEIANIKKLEARQEAQARQSEIRVAREQMRNSIRQAKLDVKIQREMDRHLQKEADVARSKAKTERYGARTRMMEAASTARTNARASKGGTGIMLFHKSKKGSAEKRPWFGRYKRR